MVTEPRNQPLLPLDPEVDAKVDGEENSEERQEKPIGSARPAGLSVNSTPAEKSSNGKKKADFVSRVIRDAVWNSPQG